MNPINLTDLQKKNLLEMISQLFPKYENVDINSHHFLTFSNSLPIHWFEFCVLYLADKIGHLLPFDGTKPTYIGSLMGSIYFNNHPVDYLFSEFKKIK